MFTYLLNDKHQHYGDKQILIVDNLVSYHAMSFTSDFLSNLLDQSLRHFNSGNISSKITITF